MKPDRAKTCMIPCCSWAAVLCFSFHFITISNSTEAQSYLFSWYSDTYNLKLHLQCILWVLVMIYWFHESSPVHFKEVLVNHCFPEKEVNVIISSFIRPVLLCMSVVWPYLIPLWSPWGAWIWIRKWSKWCLQLWCCYVGASNRA